MPRVQGFISSSESQQWTGKVQLEMGGTTQDRIVILTECCLYIFGIAGPDQFVKEETRSIFDLMGCSIQQDCLTITFSTGALVLHTPECSALQTNIYRQHRYLTWNIDIDAFREHPFLPIASIPQSLTVPAPPQRPVRILSHRYIAACVSKGTVVEKDFENLAFGFDIRPVKTLDLKHSENQVESRNPERSAVFPFLYALSMEPSLRTLVFDNFGTDIFGKILNIVLVHQNRLRHVVLKNYHAFENYQENFVGLTNHRSPYNRLERLTFESCESLFVQQFLQAARGTSSSIECVVFQKMEFTDTLSQVFLTALESYTLFSCIQTLVFGDFLCELPLSEFLRRAVDVGESVKQLVVKNCGIDVCPFVAALSHGNCHLQTLSLRRNYGNSQMGPEDFVPESIMNLDLGDCVWTAPAMSSFLSTLLRRGRHFPLIFNLDQSQFESGTWFDVFSKLPVDQFKPAITEFDMSGNVMDVKEVEAFVKVLSTQSPVLEQGGLKLAHLSLARCFTRDFEECFRLLSKFWSIRSLWGLNLSEVCDKEHADALRFVIEDLREIQGLVSVDLSGNPFDEVAASSLVAFVRESPSIAEIGLDGIALDSDILLRLYDPIVNSNRVLAMNSPIRSLEDLSSIDDARARRIYGKLYMKRKLATPHQRLLLYLSLSNIHGVRVMRPYEDVDEGENDPLFESGFRNPIPSLSEVSSSLNTALDPLAYMVIECISTSGQSGVLPPTVPPMTPPPTGDLLLPSVFATIASVATDFPHVDETGDEIFAASEELANSITGEPVSIFGNHQECDPRRVMCIPVFNFVQAK